ncbi:MAG: RNase P subunit p30 family protein [Candidatus Altiarchaeota archaeon]|nr:RNase P subunit p30 family protein [Candidatus Altiarchaeota archaeon]
MDKKNRACYDLCVRTPGTEALDRLAACGWTGVCVAREYTGAKMPSLPPKIGGMEVYNGAIITQDIEKNARKALDAADIIIAAGGSDDANRAAAECHEVDILLHPEKGREKDNIDSKNAGLDHVMAAMMAERGTALGIDFSQLLSCTGRWYAQLAGRIRQNVKVALKYHVPIVLASGARDTLGIRAPLDLAAAGRLIGIPEHDASKVVSSYPRKVVSKMKDRKNPNILLKGLEVTDWGGQKPKEPKRKYGWY